MLKSEVLKTSEDETKDLDISQRAACCYVLSFLRITPTPLSVPLCPLCSTLAKWKSARSHCVTGTYTALSATMLTCTHRPRHGGPACDNGSDRAGARTSLASEAPHRDGEHEV